MTTTPPVTEEDVNIHVAMDNPGEERLDQLTDAIMDLLDRDAGLGLVLSTHPGNCEDDDHCFGPGSPRRATIVADIAAELHRRHAGYQQAQGTTADFLKGYDTAARAVDEWADEGDDHA